MNSPHIYGFFWVLLSLSLFPQFGDSYTHPKTLALYVFFIWSCFQLKPLIALNRKAVALLALLLVSYVTSILINWPGAYALLCLEWIGFAFATVALAQSLQAESSYSDFSNKLLPWVRGSLLVVLGYSLLQEFGAEPLPQLWHNEFAASFFGFQNMTAEFYVLSLALILSHWIWSIHPTQRWPDLVLATAATAALIATGSRSSLLAFLAMLAVLVAFSRRRLLVVSTLALSLILAAPLGVWLLKRPNVARVAGSGALTSSPEIKLSAKKPFDSSEPAAPPIQALDEAIKSPSQETLSQEPSPVTSRLLESKQQTARTRLIRLRNSLIMAWNHPLGVGPGNYEFSYFAYRSSYDTDPEANSEHLPRSPHNAYLELAIENGWVSLILVLVAGFLLMRRLLRERRKWQACSIDEVWCLSSLAYLCVYACLAFPMELPFPFFVAVLLSARLIVMLRARTDSPHITLRFPRAIAWCGAAGGIAALSLWLTVHVPGITAPHRLKDVGCQIFPDLWQPCLAWGYGKLEKGDAEGAYQSAEALLKGRPLNYPAQLLKASASWMLHKDEEVCASLKLYEQATGRAMSVRELIGLAHSDTADSSPSVGILADGLCK